jgi:hypothetical protein
MHKNSAQQEIEFGRAPIAFCAGDGKTHNSKKEKGGGEAKKNSGKEKQKNVFAVE